MSMRHRTLTLTLSIPMTRIARRVFVPARRDLAAQCAREIKQFAQRHGVPVHHIDYETHWGS